jgi:hypothetical protein
MVQRQRSERVGCHQPQKCQGAGPRLAAWPIEHRPDPPSPTNAPHQDLASSTGKDDAQGAENATSEPKDQELAYAARVSLDHEQMQVDDRLINLSPGMAVTVEIKTGTRRIISYLLSPLARYTHDSLRER